jgi:hypothetical protein
VISQILLCKQITPDFRQEELCSITKDSQDVRRMVQDMQEFMPQQENNTGGPLTSLTHLFLLPSFRLFCFPFQQLSFVAMSSLSHNFPGFHFPFFAPRLPVTKITDIAVVSDVPPCGLAINFSVQQGFSCKKKFLVVSLKGLGAKINRSAVTRQKASN